MILRENLNQNSMETHNQTMRVLFINTMSYYPYTSDQKIQISRLDVIRFAHVMMLYNLVHCNEMHDGILKDSI